MISFTYRFGAGEKKEKKPAMSEKEKYRAETARMAAEQANFGKAPQAPGPRAAQDQAYWDAFWRMKGKDPMNPLNLPGLKKKEEEKSLLMMRKEGGARRSAAWPHRQFRMSCAPPDSRSTLPHGPGWSARSAPISAQCACTLPTRQPNRRAR